MTLRFFERLSVRVETVANFMKLSSTLDGYERSVQLFSWSIFFFCSTAQVRMNLPETHSVPKPLVTVIKYGF